MTFADRSSAGLLLAASMNSYRDRKDTIILALPRGGVVVGREIAVHLGLPLDVLVVRKIGLPDFPEMAIGAIAPDGIQVLSEEDVKRFQISLSILQAVIESEEKELRRRMRYYRRNKPYPDLHEKTVILIDDGLATGQTMMAAIAWVRQHKPRELLLAVPVGAPEICQMLSEKVDRLICLSSPPDFHAVGAAYDDFRQVTDDEVIAALSAPVDRASNPDFVPGDGIPLVKSARIKLSFPPVAEIGLDDGRIVKLTGEAAREPINAITAAKESSTYHSTLGVPLEGGGVLVLAVDGKHLDAVFRN